MATASCGGRGDGVNPQLIRNPFQKLGINVNHVLRTLVKRHPKEKTEIERMTTVAAVAVCDRESNTSARHPPCRWCTCLLLPAHE